jgi:hypothetical protein
MAKSQEGYKRGQGRWASDVKLTEGRGDPGNSSGKTAEADWAKLRNKNGRDSGPSYKDASK